MTIAALISLIIVLGSVFYIVWGFKAKNGVSYRYALIILIAAVFLGLVIIGYPLAYSEYRSAYPSGNIFWIYISVLFQSVQNALRTFVLDGSWSELLSGKPGGVEIPMAATVVGLTLNVAAPILTFSAILSIFKQATSKLRWHAMISSRRPLFMFSELNKDTVILAESIRQKYKNANLLYTDVFPEDDETNFELRERAGKLHAVMLRTDISEFDLKGRDKKTVMFLLGHDEEENVMQARKLFRKNKGRKNTEIYVMAVKKGNRLIVDLLTSSVDKEKYLEEAAANGWTYDEFKEKIYNGEFLKLRRTDPERLTALREIPRIEGIRNAFRQKGSKDKTLSILLFADTHLSFAFIKMLLWYCQSDKFRLEMNIVYADNFSSQDAILSGRAGEVVNVKSLLEFECPEIIRTNRAEKDGDSFYDIEFIENSAFESGDFQNTLIGIANNETDGTELTKRLLRTDIVIVDRGNDGATIETAEQARMIFERLKRRENRDEAKLTPEIYAVCADEENSLRDINERSFTTYRGESYDIRIIGRRSETFTYDNIINADEERLGLCQHTKWIDVEYNSAGSGEQADRSEHDRQLKSAMLDYERYEYFRDASIAKGKYLRNVLADPELELTEDEVEAKIRDYQAQGRTADDNTRFEWRLRLRPEYECLKGPGAPADRWRCTCDNCVYRRKLEHNRWNAFMRSEGYISSPWKEVNDKRPIARVHGNLVAFDDLDQTAKDKDG